jgi:hypothetical protein
VPHCATQCSTMTSQMASAVTWLPCALG